jgi:hypothetical protein
MKKLLSALVVLSFSCVKFEVEDTGAQGSAIPTPSGGEDLPTENGLPDWATELDETGCEIQQATGVAGPGAATYFYGMYTGSDSSFVGYEEWHVFANETWEENGGYDCIIRWTVTAVESEQGPCAACDLSVYAIFSVNEAQSTCPEDLIEDASASSSVQYDILRTSDGVSQWYFGGSGAQFGTGAWNNQAMNFITPKSCSWF